MKIKHKGKVFPSPASSSPSPAARDDNNVLSVMKLLPAAILALASALSSDDREVLAYMIMRSLDTTSNVSSPFSASKGSASRKRTSKKQPAGAHRPPVFGCDCFDCYTSYWLRWDSSANRELIHQVIEAFEEHLNSGEASSNSKKAGRGKRRDKHERRLASSQPETELVSAPPPAPVKEAVISADGQPCSPLASPEKEAVPMTPPEMEKQEVLITKTQDEDAVECGGPPELAMVAAAGSTGGGQHKGLARKVLPDVLGLLNSRLWNLWNPNV